MDDEGLVDWLEEVIQAEAQEATGAEAEPPGQMSVDAAAQPGQDLEQSTDAEATSAFAYQLAQVIGEVAAPLGLDADAEPDEMLDEGIVPEAPADEVAVAPPEPWQQLSEPSPVGGHVNLEGRTVLRIQRNKPVGRCTTTCYRHRRCHFLLNMGRTPPNDVIYKWLFEVPAFDPSRHTLEEGKALAAEHTTSAKSQWSAPQPAVP